MKNQTLLQRDLAVLWHPCTQMKDHEQLPLIPIRSGKGIWLEDFEGKESQVELLYVKNKRIIL